MVLGSEHLSREQCSVASATPFNTIQISYLRRQNGDGKVVMIIKVGECYFVHIVLIQMPCKTRAKCPARELAAIRTRTRTRSPETN
jgi:hypothetical protein